MCILIAHAQQLQYAVYNRWTGLVDWTTGLTDFHFKHTFGGSIIRLKRRRSKNSGYMYKNSDRCTFYWPRLSTTPTQLTC